MTAEQEETIIILAQAGVISKDEALALLHRPWWRRVLDWLRGLR